MWNNKKFPAVKTHLIYTKEAAYTNTWMARDVIYKTTAKLFDKNAYTKYEK